jgi:hypothetical protein
VKRRKISSGHARFYRERLPSIWLLVWGIVIGVTLLTGNNPILFVIIFAFGFVIYYFGNKSVYEVEIDAQALYVSNSQQEIRILFRDIQSVMEKFDRPNRIQIRLKNSTAFGKTIAFIPAKPHLISFGRHPLVSELEKLAHLTETENQN